MEKGETNRDIRERQYIAQRGNGLDIYIVGKSKKPKLLQATLLRTVPYCAVSLYPATCVQHYLTSEETQGSWKARKEVRLKLLLDRESEKSRQARKVMAERLRSSRSDL